MPDPHRIQALTRAANIRLLEGALDHARVIADAVSQVEIPSAADERALALVLEDLTNALQDLRDANRAEPIHTEGEP